MNRRFQHGVTMVESLVALVVLSVGMLGIASLYVSSLKAERSAQIRTQAINLVSDMADRIRANVPAREYYGVAKYGTPSLHNCVVTSNCSITDLAEDDLARWIDTAKKTLPGTTQAPKATVVVTTAAGGLPDQYRIAVAWREPGDETDLTYQNTLEIIPGKP
jgi:type IV pilus assembly protein PilV